MGRKSNPTSRQRVLTVNETDEIQAFRQLRSGFHGDWETCLRHQNAASEFDESPDDWLARTAYLHLRKIVAEDRWPMLEYLVDYERSLKKGRHSIKGKPFKVGLIAILGDKIRLLRNRRAELSDAMEYAYTHNVTSKHFNGFVKQAGQKKIAAKLARGHVEPGFKRDRMRPLPRDRASGFPLITPD